jgi:hypothetical protein
MAPIGTQTDAHPLGLGFPHSAQWLVFWGVAHLAVGLLFGLIFRRQALVP